MKRHDSGTSAGLSEMESPVTFGPENGELTGNEAGAPRHSPECPPHDPAVARLRLLWQARRFLGRVTGMGLLLSTLAAFLIPKHYQSSARLMPPDNQSSSGLAMAAMALTAGAGGGLGGMAGELLGLKSTSDLLVGVLGSRTVEDRLVDRFDLETVYGTRWLESARKDLEVWTDVSVDRKSQIVTLKVTDRNPERAAAIAGAYVEELNRTLAEVSTSAARRERIFLEARLQGVTRDLESAERDFSRFASQNTAIDIKEQGKAMVEAAALLQGQLIAARSELEGLRQIYADSNVRVRSMQARVAELENQLRKIGGQGEDDSAASASPNDASYPSIRQLPLLGVPYADLYRRTRVQEAVFEALTKEYEMAKVQEAKEIPRVKVLDAPNVPERKSFPPRLLLMMLGTGLAFWFGATWIFVRTRWEQTDAADPWKALALEVFHAAAQALWLRTPRKQV